MAQQSFKGHTEYEPRRRHNLRGYRMSSSKDEQISFARVEKPDYGFSATSNLLRAPSWMSEEERALENEIKASVFVLSIQDEINSADFVPYTLQTLSRATSFLHRLMVRAHASNVVGIGVPKIGPADEGSIDVFWEKEDRTLLVNFPADPSAASYYGKKPQSEISGKFDPAAAVPELATWLAEK